MPCSRNKRNSDNPWCHTDLLPHVHTVHSHRSASWQASLLPQHWRPAAPGALPQLVMSSHGQLVAQREWRHGTDTPVCASAQVCGQGVHECVVAVGTRGTRKQISQRK